MEEFMFSDQKKPAWPVIIVFLISILYTQDAISQTITGKVYDAESREILVGAAVKQQGTTRGVVTNKEGSFKLRLSEDGRADLVVSYLGFKEKLVDVSARQKNLKIYLYPKTFIGDDVLVKALRVDESTPMTYTNVERAEIEKRNLGQDVPYLLQNTPSVITTSDAGAGIGYTGIRIRGVDPARINVTINGIPVNDAESHGVFWVDLPDLASSIENIQIQREGREDGSGG